MKVLSHRIALMSCMLLSFSLSAMKKGKSEEVLKEGKNFFPRGIVDTRLVDDLMDITRRVERGILSISVASQLVDLLEQGMKCPGVGESEIRKRAFENARYYISCEANKGEWHILTEDFEKLSKPYFPTVDCKRKKVCLGKPQKTSQVRSLLTPEGCTFFSPSLGSVGVSLGESTSKSKEAVIKTVEERLETENNPQTRKVLIKLKKMAEIQCVTDRIAEGESDLNTGIATFRSMHDVETDVNVKKAIQKELEILGSTI